MVEGITRALNLGLLIRHITVILLLLAAAILGCDDPEQVMQPAAPPAPTAAAAQPASVDPTQAPVAVEARPTPPRANAGAHVHACAYCDSHSCRAFHARTGPN